MPRLTSAFAAGEPSSLRAMIVYDATSRGLNSFLFGTMSSFSILSRAGTARIWLCSNMSLSFTNETFR